jgi:general stress protein 26
MKSSKLESHEVQIRPQRNAEAREAVKRLGELVRGIRVAMLTTVRPNGHLHSRPMMTQESELDDELWFFVDSRSAITDEITECHQVVLAYVDPSRERYVSVSGVAQLLREPDLIRRYWNHRAAEWFPNGPDNDPSLAVLRVQLEEAQYWDATSKSMVKMRGLDASDEKSIPVVGSAEGATPIEAPTREA